MFPNKELEYERKNVKEKLGSWCNLFISWISNTTKYNTKPIKSSVIDMYFTYRNWNIHAKWKKSVKKTISSEFDRVSYNLIVPL